MYKLENLPYLFQDLEPFLDTHTLGLHYNKHAQNYLNNLNKLLMKNNFDYRYDINELAFHINEFAKEAQESILFNLGGVINHNLYLSHGYIPLFNVDLWEHAYYLNYENDKSKYLDNFVQIADFTFANKIYNNISIIL